MAENRLQKYDGAGFVTLKGMAQMHSTKPNKTGGNWSQNNGGVDFITRIFRGQIGQYPNVMELFHWLTHPH